MAKAKQEDKNLLIVLDSNSFGFLAKIKLYFGYRDFTSAIKRALAFMATMLDTVGNDENLEIHIFKKDPDGQLVIVKKLTLP